MRGFSTLNNLTIIPQLLMIILMMTLTLDTSIPLSRTYQPCQGAVFREIICGSFTNQLEISVVEEIFLDFSEMGRTQPMCYSSMSLEATFSCKFGGALLRKLSQLNFSLNMHDRFWKISPTDLLEI